MRARSSAAALAVLLLSAVTAAPASAAVEGDWAGWSAVGGTATAFTTSVALPGLGGPVAEVTSTAATTTVVSGASTWLGPLSPPGAAYGSSRDRAYLNQSPRANAADSPAVTTYTFSEPPAPGWGLVLGDLDADEATVSAVGVDGQPLDVAELGFQGAFNLCTTTPRPSTLCAGNPTDVPTWLPGAATLRGNPAAANTSGASGWFRPTVPVRSLTVAFRWRAGFPIYQTWLAGQTRTVSGTLAGAGCDVAGATVSLLDGDTVLAQVETAADGAWSVPGVSARDGLTARLDTVPAGCRLVEGGSAVLPVAAAAEDDPDLAFAVEPVPVAVVEVTGVVEDADGRPVPGAGLVLVGPEDDPVELPAVVSDGEGQVTLPAVTPGTYEATLTPPAGYTVSPATATVVVPPEGGEIDLGFVVEQVTATPSPSADPSGSPSAGPSQSPAPTASSSPVPSSPPSAGTSSGTGVLPATGGPSGGLLPLGGVLLAAGAVLLLAGRRHGARR